jgi:hypothetical protein
VSTSFDNETLLDEVSEAANVPSDIAFRLRLESLRMFGREAQIEEVLALLDFPTLKPSTVIFTGPAAAGRHRFLHALLELFSGQMLPVAEVACRPGDMHEPFSLAIRVLHQFLSAFSRNRLAMLTEPVVQANPWLSWFFPVFRHLHSSVPPPRDAAEVLYGLAGTFTALASALPHLAVVYNLPYADRASCQLLQQVMGLQQHGLRLLIAGDESDHPSLDPLKQQGALQVPLAALSEGRVRDYLEEIAVELGEADIAGALFAQSGGWPLAMEARLLTWLADGSLAQVDGRWQFTPPAEDAVATLDNVTGLTRWLQAASHPGITLPILARVWQVSEEEAAGVIDTGRRLGFFRPVTAADPLQVAVTSPDHQAYLQQALSPDVYVPALADVDRAVGELMATRLRASRAAAPAPAAKATPVAGEQAGVDEDALALPPDFAIVHEYAAEGLDASISARMQTWDQPPPLPVDADALKRIIQTATSLRLAALQYRLYPPHGQPVEECLSRAIDELQALFRTRPSLTLTWNGDTLAFDGEVIERSDFANVARDYCRWMEDGHLQALGIARGVEKSELGRFLQALASYEMGSGAFAVLGRITSVQAAHIRFVTRAFSESEPTPSALVTHEHILRHLTLCENFVADPQSQAPVPEVAAEPPDHIELPADAQPHPFTVTQESLPELTALLDSSDPYTRGVLMSNLLTWLTEQATQAAVPGSVDTLIRGRLDVEEHPGALPPTISVAEFRLQWLCAQRAWSDVATYLGVTCARYYTDTDPVVHRHFAELLMQVGQSEIFHEWLGEIDTHSERVTQIAYLVALLGEYALRPLLERLASSEVQTERQFLVNLLGKLCADQQHLLVEELRAERPWYYHRNLLLILENMATLESLEAITLRIDHPHPNVRAHAIAAAVTTTGSEAYPFLARGLADKHPSVRAHTLGLLRHHALPALLPDILSLLVARKMWENEEPEEVQAAACYALAFYHETTARKALIEMLNPGSLFRKRTEFVRAAAAAALAHHQGDPTVRAALERAAQDPSALVNQTARQSLR